MPRKIYVGGLGSAMSDGDLKAAFSRFGLVVEAIVATERNSGTSKGFGFVTFNEASEAALAIATMNGVALRGHVLKVNVAGHRTTQVSFPGQRAADAGRAIG